MAAITPAEFYQANADKEKEYVRVHTAYKLAAGEKIYSIYHHLAPEDGYDLGGETFLTNAEFAAQTTPAGENLELPLPREDLDADALQKITPIDRSGTYVSFNNNGGNPLRCTVPHGGYIMPTDDGNDYLSSFELTSRFNCASLNHGMEKIAVFTLNEEQPFKGIIIDTETVFAFKDRERTAGAGSVLVQDPESADGYALMHFYPAGSNSVNGGLRLSAAWTQHKEARAKQVKLRSRASRVRIK